MTLSPSQKRKRARWRRLGHLIGAYADARVADAAKGGGDPLDVPAIMLRLQLAKMELNVYIHRLSEGVV